MRLPDPVCERKEGASNVVDFTVGAKVKYFYETGMGIARQALFTKLSAD
jgi:hypothetical protein